MTLLVYPEVSSAVVLCIDDSQAMLECERAFLEAFGYTVLTASSSSVGLELASVHPVDVVILDMPAMNGRGVARAVKRLRPRAPIILLTEGLAVPNETLNQVDALVEKNNLASHLLPAIAHFRGYGRVLPAVHDA